MKTIGKTLREARERQGLSIEDVAGSTKIHPYKLVAIEEDDRNLLPARVFAIGLIKSYARELKVDMMLIDELCQKAFAENDSSPITAPANPTTSPPSQEPPVETQPVGLFQIPKPFAILLSLVFILTLILSIYFVAQKMDSYSQEEAQVNSILDFEQDASEKETQDAAIDSKAEPTAQKPGPIQNPPEVSLPEKKTADQPLSESKPVAVELEDDNNFEAEAVNTTESKQEDDSQSPVVSLSDQKLTVKALDKVRIEIIWSDGFNQGLILKQNESKTLIFSSPIRVRIDNGGAVDVSFNDKRQGVPGSLNKPIELKFP